MCSTHSELHAEYPFIRVKLGLLLLKILWRNDSTSKTDSSNSLTKKIQMLKQSWKLSVLEVTGKEKKCV